MPNEKNETEYSGGPKKADIIIKNTQNIVAKQDDLNKQAKLAVSRIEEAIGLFAKNNQDASYIVKQSGEIFTRLQDENSSLKQELLYLAKQSENIYTGLAEKINELSEREKTREEALSGFADRLNDVAEQTRKGEEAYSMIADKLADIAKQNKRSEELFAELNDKLNAVKYDAASSENEEVTEKAVSSEVDLSEVLEKLDLVSEQLSRNEKAYADLSDRAPAAGTAETPAGLSEVLNELSLLSEQIKRSDGTHSMLADKFEILSMRIEQYMLESSKFPAGAQASPAAPVSYSAVIPAANVEIDYDKLAEKLASLVSSQEVISPDYIASKVAEQIIIPEPEAAVNLSVDGDYIASKVIEHLSLPDNAPAVNCDEIAEKVAKRISEINAEEIAAANVEGDVDETADESESKTDEDSLVERISRKIEEIAQPAIIDEEWLAECIVRKIGEMNIAPAAANADIDEEELADKLAAKLSAKSEENAPALNEEELAERIVRKIGETNIINVASAETNAGIDEEELADAISLKVGSLKAEDFEILVDDAGCSSISKVIAENLDYNTISGIIADKLREALDLAAVNAPDYEEMAERISEKITVAGINEDAIAEKAAAVLSNYLPDFDADEITDKITGAVIDVVSAIPQPSIDSDAICDTITNKLIESQEDHDYDIVIDDDGITKITDLVCENVEKQTGVRFDKVEEDIAKLTELVNSVTTEENEAETGEEAEAESEEEAVEIDYSALSEVVAAEIEKGVAVRFDNLESGINKLTEIISAEPEEEEYAEDGESEETVEFEDDYAELSEMVANEVEKRVSPRLDNVEENIAKISDMLGNGGNGEISEVKGDVKEIKSMLAGGILVSAAEAAAARPAEAAEEDEQELVTVSDLVETSEEEEADTEEEKPAAVPADNGKDFLIDVLDLDAFGDDELMPGQASEYGEGVDFANMMKYNRSFIARIIQSDDDTKRFYGETKHALLSYRKVNSNVAWGAERFNKGRETIARLKIRGKTLCLYLALDPANYKTSVYHHSDVSDNKSVAGTPMMVKIKSPLGVKKAIRLIDEMLNLRNGEKREIPERDYASMYPYETIEELIEDGLVKDVRKDNK